MIWWHILYCWLLLGVGVNMGIFAMDWEKKPSAIDQVGLWRLALIVALCVVAWPMTLLWLARESECD